MSPHLTEAEEEEMHRLFPVFSVNTTTQADLDAAVARSARQVKEQAKRSAKPVVKPREMAPIAPRFFSAVLVIACTYFGGGGWGFVAAIAVLVCFKKNDGRAL